MFLDVGVWLSPALQKRTQKLQETLGLGLTHVQLILHHRLLVLSQELKDQGLVAWVAEPWLCDTYS